MPWWSWIVIWIALIALSLLYLVLLGIKLWRHLTRLGKDVSDLSGKLSRTIPGSSDAWNQSFDPASRGPSPVRQELVPLLSADEAADSYRRGKAERRSARIHRRVSRRRRRGQAQSLSDLRHVGDM